MVVLILRWEGNCMGKWSKFHKTRRRRGNFVPQHSHGGKWVYTKEEIEGLIKFVTIKNYEVKEDLMFGN